ncbi:MAG: PEP-CTERM sorting domain-containing protein [Gammaproteobacteria bacterium]|nr:PEP-CTERM sorting domain-containing protein [Gammaproteobacteria bacterium]
MKASKSLLAGTFLLFSSVCQASYIVNFAELADGENNGGGALTTGPLGESAHNPLKYEWDDMVMRVIGMENPTGKVDDTGKNYRSYAYLDSGNAGLGVCTIVDDDGQCNPSSDDNVSFEEFIRIQFDQAVNVESITINNNHDGGFTDSSRLKIETDILDSGDLNLGIVSNTLTNDDLGWVLDMANSNWTESFTLRYLGKSDQIDRHFYLESIEFSKVPEPSILALMGLGIFGLSLTRRKIKK